MKFKVLILSILSFTIFTRASAQETSTYTQPRILFLLDESSSMLQQWSNGRPKFKMANEIIDKLMDSVIAVNPNVQFSLRVFGNQHTVQEHDCTDTRSEVPFSPDNRTQMSFRLDDMRPLGVTAIAFSLSEAAEKDLIDEKHNAYSIILITDGGESCGGDICGVMQKLLRNKVFFKPYVLSLEDAPELKDEYACMGSYLSVTKQADISKAVSKIVEAFKPMLSISQQDFRKLQVLAAKAPSALKVAAPAINTEVPIEDKTPKKDTVKTEPVTPKKTSSIVVGEEPKRPAPVTMKKMQLGGMRSMFVGKVKFKPLPVVSAPLTITVKEEDIAEPRQPLPTLTPARMGKMRPVKVPHVVFGSMPVATATMPEIKTEQPFTAPAPVKMPHMVMPAYKKISVAKNNTAARKVALPALEIKTTPEEEPVVRTQTKMVPVAIGRYKKLTTNAVVKNAKPMKISVPEIKTELPEPELPPVVRTAPVKLSKLKPGRFRMHLLYVNTFLDSDLKPIKMAVPPIKTELPAPAATPPAKTTATKPGTKPTTATPAKPAKTGEYTVSHDEDAPETTLEVYLTNGKGKFYTSSPRVFLADPATGKEVKRFFRTVDASGNPDPVTNLATGNYELTIAGRDDLLAKVEIVANKKNKVYVKVRNGNLEFYYYGAPGRPVKEYTATVIQRNVANGKVDVQKCSEKKEYEPGNYHIVINTYPEDRRNTDLDDMTSPIGIYQPGFAKFTSEIGNNVTASLWKELGDKFVQFDVISLADPTFQHVAIQPGKYQIHYNNGQTKYGVSEKVIPFQVYSNKDVEVKLVK